MVIDKKISSRSAKDLLAIAVIDSRKPEIIAAEKGLFQTSSASDLEPIIEKIMQDNTTVVSDFKAGKAVALEYLVGQGMKALRGAVDPNSLRALFIAKIGQ
jgi:aspartyl-tRNA(Asn)/glutamyl-tRNA(Gln) amidotransferase subunit B